jgi:beta-lactamase superfamily II metal-dependent hydrolase
MPTLQMLPAAHGDALLLEWDDAGVPHRMLVDGGPLGTYRTVHDRIAALGESPHLDLLVVTHIDGDHLEGVIRLLQDRAAMKLTIDDVWFNGWPQIKATRSDVLGPDQGEMIGALLIRDGLSWNTLCGKQAIQLPQEGEPPVIELPGGATVTVLGPGPDQLNKLRREWLSVLKDVYPDLGKVKQALARLAKRADLAGIEDLLGSKAVVDNSVANGSSICLLFEHGDRSLLLTGDSHGDVLAAGLHRLLKQRGRSRLQVDAVKLPHHCSSANVTDEFLALIDCNRYLVSTNGARYQHPDAEAVWRVLKQEHRADTVELVFNYRSTTTEDWGDSARQQRYRYTATFPDDQAVGAVVQV